MKTADEMFEELGYKKKNLDIVFSRFLEEWENEDLAKTFSFNTEYETVDIIDENRYGITMPEKETREQKYRRISDLYNKFSFLFFQTTHEAGWQDELNSIIVELRRELRNF